MDGTPHSPPHGIGGYSLLPIFWGLSQPQPPALAGGHRLSYLWRLAGRGEFWAWGPPGLRAELPPV